LQGGRITASFFVKIMKKKRGEEERRSREEKDVRFFPIEILLSFSFPSYCKSQPPFPLFLCRGYG
jgi:hypothetical protein